MFIPIEFQKSFQKTRQAYYAIIAEYEDDIDVLSSKFGGNFYWETGRELPKGTDDKPLALLAQINFSEIPEHPLLPEQGIVQIFTPRSDEDYGANLGEVGGKSQILVKFWSTPCSDKVIHEFFDVNESDLVPAYGGHKLTFVENQASAGIDTIECAVSMGDNPLTILEDVSLDEKEVDQFYENIIDHCDAFGHKLLGYPGFIKGDPREDDSYKLFLQIDTDTKGDNDIIFGDNGVAQFFISEQDLQERKFENMWFYWDC